jgi:hypothetical protein
MKTFFLINITLTALLLYSCETPLNVDAPFRQRYVLNGIMRNDSSVQYVSITRTYRPVNDINPASDTSNKFIVGANVNIWYNDTVYTLRDTSLFIDTSGYKDTVHFYYIANLKPGPGQNMQIQAVLPNGLLLQSNTTLPDISTENFFDPGNDLIAPPANGNSYIYILWQSLGVVYQPRIMIEYYKTGSSQIQYHPVPLLYSNQNGKSTPIYPGPTTTNFLTIDMSTISTAINEIAANEQDKVNYSIFGIDIQLIVYDQNLSTYYSSLQNSVNDFTVIINPPDYSNIQGGYGIFGSFSRTDYYLRINNKYLDTLGYSNNY